LIKESQPYIEEYDELKELIQERYQEKKEASVNLPDLKSRQKKLTEEIEKRKKGLGNIQ
jgi:CHASE3 domain sensor protein